MILKEGIEAKLRKEFKLTLERYVSYKDANNWKRSKGYIDKGDIDNIVYWLIDKIKTTD